MPRVDLDVNVAQNMPNTMKEMNVNNQKINKIEASEFSNNALLTSVQKMAVMKW